MFAWGNCQAGDRLVMERKLGRFPNEEDLSVHFSPGVRFYFEYEKSKASECDMRWRIACKGEGRNSPARLGFQDCYSRFAKGCAPGIYPQWSEGQNNLC